VANVVPVFVALVQSLLHEDNIEVTYVGTLNLKMEPIISAPLHFVATT
jgi:hypothetical protein